MELLPTGMLCVMPRLCKDMRASTAAIDGGWHAFVDSRIVRFRNGSKYVSTPTGWSHHIGVYTVSVPTAVRKRRPTQFRMVEVGSNRYKVRVHNGVEFIRMGSNYKYPTICASDTHIDWDMIRSHNDYWSM